MIQLPFALAASSYSFFFIANSLAAFFFSSFSASFFSFLISSSASFFNFSSSYYYFFSASAFSLRSISSYQLFGYGFIFLTDINSLTSSSVTLALFSWNSFKNF
jgi:hypothetical protein